MKSILFNTKMVRAILEGRKTVTRMLVKPQQLQVIDSPYHQQHPETPDKVLLEKLCEPPCRPGDILYVRETWQYAYDLDWNEQPIEGTGRYLYAADDLPDPFGFWVNPDGTHRDSMPWRPSIHMPREAARIFLRVTDVRVERLQDITEENARAEGAREIPWAFDVDDVDGKIKSGPMQNVIQNFAGIWESTIKPADRALYGWSANPWVWVIEFEWCENPEREDDNG